MDPHSREETTKKKEKEKVIPLLPSSFYLREDVVAIGRELLGKFLFTSIDGSLTGGMITETECYKGAEDKACHAYQNRRTKRTEVMFAEGGVAYVYLCYGMHNLLNIVTNQRNVPHAILIRSIKPTIGIETMLIRRDKNCLDSTLTTGPGTVTEALGITRSHNGISLQGSTIWLEDRKISFDENQIIASPRVGISYAEEHAHLPWRFRIMNLKKDMVAK